MAGPCAKLLPVATCRTSKSCPTGPDWAAVALLPAAPLAARGCFPASACELISDSSPPPASEEEDEEDRGGMFVEFEARALSQFGGRGASSATLCPGVLLVLPLLTGRVEILRLAPRRRPLGPFPGGRRAVF